MSGYADTIREYVMRSAGHTLTVGSDERHWEALAALDALEAELVRQADRIAWLEGEVAGWRIKLAECEERHG